MPRYLYLPIEVGSRELPAKTLIAGIAAERGFTVVLGFQHSLIRSAASLPAGVFLSKGSNNSFLAYVPKLRAAGHLVAVSEEENYGYRLTHNPVSYNSRLLQDRCDLYLCIGPDESKHIARRYGAQFPQAVTGNARTDFLRPRLRRLYEADVANIKREHGKFILLNSNLGLTNPATRVDPTKFYLLWVDIGMFDEDDHKKNQAIFNAFFHWEQYNAKIIRDLLGLLAKRPEISVIVRPHPAEWHDGWVQYLTSLGAPQIRVVRNTPHIPYMLASELVVHAGCATGMEALALGVPALSLKGNPSSPINETAVSNDVNVTASTALDAFDLIQNHLNGGDKIRRHQPSLAAKLTEYLADFSEDILSSERIVDVLSDLAVRAGTDARRVETASWSSIEDPSGFFGQKFGVTDEWLAKTLASLRHTLGRFTTVRETKLFDGIYEISDPLVRQSP